MGGEFSIFDDTALADFENIGGIMPMNISGQKDYIDKRHKLVANRRKDQNSKAYNRSTWNSAVTVAMYVNGCEHVVTAENCASHFGHLRKTSGLYLSVAARAGLITRVSRGKYTKKEKVG